MIKITTVVSPDALTLLTAYSAETGIMLTFKAIPQKETHRTTLLSYWLIFLSAFGAATILPFYSEIAVAAGLQQGGDAWLIWAVASAGNTAGAVVNWVLGRYLLHFQHRRWFPFKPQQLEQGQRWFNKYGVWTLLLAWLPVGGDVLTLIAGILRVRLWLFVILVGIGKALRYAVVILTLQSVF